MKTFDIIVKDLSVLEYYGFIHIEASAYSPDRYEFYCKNRPCFQMRVETAKKKILLNSPNTTTIKTICEMYKDGVIKFVDYRTMPKYTLSLSKEEYDAIITMRKGEQK